MKTPGPGALRARLVVPLSLVIGVVIVGTLAIAGPGAGSGARGWTSSS